MKINLNALIINELGQDAGCNLPRFDMSIESGFDLFFIKRKENIYKIKT